MTARPPAAPRELGSAGRPLWRSVAREYELRGSDLALLRQACDTADHCAQLAKLASAQPPVIRGRLGQEMAHPARSELRSERRLLLALLGGLGLTASGAEPPGPSPVRERW